MSQYHMECFACTIWDLFILKKKKKVFIVYLRINWASCLLLGNPTWFLWRPRLFVNYWLTVSSASTSMSVCAFVCSFPWDPTEERGCQSREGQCAALASEAWINLGGGHGPEAVVGAHPPFSSAMLVFHCLPLWSWPDQPVFLRDPDWPFAPRELCLIAA